MYAESTLEDIDGLVTTMVSKRLIDLKCCEVTLINPTMLSVKDT